MMKTPVLLVTVALTVAILLAASLVIATGTRGADGKAVSAKRARPLHNHRPATARSASRTKFDII